MQGKEHNLILGIIFLIEFIIYALFTFLFVVVFAFQVIFMLGKSADIFVFATNSGIFLIVIFVFLCFTVPLGFASWKLLKHKKNARIWGIISAVISLPIMFPIGLVIGVYGLWFFLSEEGKQFYNGNYVSFNSPQIPTNNWR